MECEIKYAEIKNKAQLLQLYKKVAEISGGIIRIQDDIKEEYISSFLKIL